jgi:hypothetical protein
MLTLAATGGKHPDDSKQPHRKSGLEGDAATNPAFDRWLTHHLGRLYDPVVHEPLPEEFIRLLESRLK